VQGGVDLTVGSDPGLTQLLGLLGDPANQSCEVGPSLGTGAVFERDAVVQPIDASTPAVVVSLRPGAEGADAWNTLAGHCYDKDPACPTGQLAVELGGWLYSAPTVQTPVFEGSVMIAGSFTDRDANVLADALNHDDPTFRLTTNSYVFSFGG
jgi:preprotein translocase subunit SecD